MPTWYFTTKISNGKDDDGEAGGTVKAETKERAVAAVAVRMREDGERKGSKLPWTAYDTRIL